MTNKAYFTYVTIENISWMIIVAVHSTHNQNLITLSYKVEYAASCCNA